MIKSFYDNSVLKHPIKVILLVLVAIGFLGYNATKVEIDASSETLLIDDDKDLKFAREVSKRYYSPDFLLVTYKPNSDLLSNTSLENLKKLTKDLLKIDEIESITSILNVPLLQSPIQELAKLVDGVRTLEKDEVDKNLVKKEFLESALYKNSLVSSDFSTTAIVLNLKTDEKYFQLLEKRNSLKTKVKSKTASSKDLLELEKVSKEFKKYRDLKREEDHQNIEKIRSVIKNYQGEAKLFLGGVGMIADDIVGFVKSDLVIYGSTLVLLLIFILWFIFKQAIWILLPLLICTLSVIATTGVLGLFGWEVTVISSNFISLQLIITISIVLHLIVRYRELALKYKKSNQYKLVINSVLSKINPSFFAIITTIAGFGSLVLSGIQPVKNLGWMMSTGIAISLFIAFLIFPAILILIKRVDVKNTSNKKSKYMSISSSFVEKRGTTIIVSSVIIVLFALTGALNLKVENSFINYFKKSTEIYKGMEVIDNKLGGTTPLDVIIRFDANKKDEPKIEVAKPKETNDDFGDFSDFEAEFEESANDEQYWFSQDKMKIITDVHDYLESIPEVGKVSSLATLLKVGKILNEGKELDGITLALLYNKLPLEYKDLILSPYINIEHNEARVNIRIIDSNPNLRRDALIKKLNSELGEVIDNTTVEFRLSNLMILYNNMLQSLFDSQIKTLGFVVTILFFMFLVLFKSIKIAIIAILANIVPISIIFGIMGCLSIPLDIMTITIAAISIGIGVDDTIHYIHRFHEEYKKDHNYIDAMKRSHESIGYAMVYTSLVVIVGFSILVLSNLIPTIYFGLLTVVVMATILLSALFLLPRLLIILQPYGHKKKLHV